MEGVRNAVAHCSRTASSHSWLRTNAHRLPTFWSSHGERVATHGTGPSRPGGGAPFPVALRIGGTLCPAPCYGETTGAPGQSSLGCCPCGAPIYGAAGHRRTSQGGGHSPVCSWPPNEPHIRPTPEWRPAPATSHSAPWGKAGTGPGRLQGGGRRRGSGGAT